MFKLFNLLIQRRSGQRAMLIAHSILSHLFLLSIPELLFFSVNASRQHWLAIPIHSQSNDSSYYRYDCSNNTHSANIRKTKYLRNN